MAIIDELIETITDDSLKLRLQQEVRKISKQKKFGLVFEEHLPECTPLYDIKVGVGKKVALKLGNITDIYTVASIKGNKAVCIKPAENRQQEFNVDDLVVVATFGDPIYPNLIPIDNICNAPDSDLWHTLIEADNYHALQLLEYLYHGKVDCIYIDPPYNTGARDWKYNNNYVDDNDEYRHSKWLSFMRKRLELARKLLNPKDSVLIITIDEKEYLHLGCLLEEMFSDAKIQMISSVINHAGTGRMGDFGRINEFIYFIRIGDCLVNAEEVVDDAIYKEVAWDSLRRHNPANLRPTRPKQFYPIYISKTSHKIVKVGDYITPDVDRFSVEALDGCETVFPVKDDGTEMMWGVIPDVCKFRAKHGYIKVGKYDPNKPQQFSLQHLSSGIIDKINEGTVKITGHRKDGSVIAVYAEDKKILPKTQWDKDTHDATRYGTNLIGSIIGKRFEYPKSLYAVRDSIKFFLKSKENAIVLDFFAGSGTTLHAVNLLNAEDGGKRKCIMVTNNEVSEEEGKILTAKGFKPGDKEWEKLGIARYVTWPRTKCSILGIDINNERLKGEYFSTLTTQIEKSRFYKQIMLDGAQLDSNIRKNLLSLLTDDKGKAKLPQKLCGKDTNYIVKENYNTTILFDTAYSSEWLEALDGNENITDIYIVTDKKDTFNKLKEEVSSLLGNILSNEPVMIPMSDGFKSNVEYFKLGFLDKNAVSLGRQFKELLPVLWLKSGSIGKRPEIKGSTIPDMLILPENKFAILVDENKFYEFKKQIEEHPEIDDVYIITGYEEGYRAKIAELKVKNTYQLYRDYLDNFRINYIRGN